MSADAITLARAHLALAELQEREDEWPKWDWYGTDCGCGPEHRKPLGDCAVHKRAHINQRPPEGDWSTWYFEAGRGSGKTEAGAQWIRAKAREKGKLGRFALVGATAADVRDTMVEGPSGILAACPEWERPVYQPSKRRVVWPNGAVAMMYSADEPERLRGPQHTDAWADELAAWHDSRPWDMLMFGMRLGDNPQTMVTTTPKPFPWLRRIKKLLGTTITKGTSYDNRDNLARNFFDTIIKPFEGTRQGRQELMAEDLEDTPGALWSLDLLDQLRIPRKLLPEFIRVVVAVDPSVADPKADPDNDTAECGITVGAMAYVQHPTLGVVPMGYLFADRSLKAHPHDWGRAVVNAYHEFKADCVVAESNNGGALVSSNIQTIDPSVPVTLIHASRGKLTRAEPVATMYEQRRVWHVEGEDFSLLESQMCNWVPGLPSPDRMDALVWLFTTLLLEGAPLEMGPSPWADWRGD